METALNLKENLKEKLKIWRKKNVNLKYIYNLNVNLTKKLPNS